MADNSVSASMEQRVVMKFLVNEGAKPSDIYRRLQAQYGDETLSRSKTFEWCTRFKVKKFSYRKSLLKNGFVTASICYRKSLLRKVFVTDFFLH